MKVTEEMEARICKMRMGGMTQREIAAATDLSLASVRMVLYNNKIDGDSGLKDTDKAWLKRNWGWQINRKLLRTRTADGKYRVVHPVYASKVLVRSRKNGKFFFDVAEFEKYRGKIWERV